MTMVEVPSPGVSGIARRGLFASMRAPGERPEVTVATGRGLDLTLADGRQVLDGGSLSSCLYGHCHPALVAAVTQAATTVYVNDETGYRAREEAADELLRTAFAEEQWADAVLFTVAASEATDLALLLAQMLTGRETLVCRELGYHGAVGLGRAVSRHPLWSHGLLDAKADDLRKPTQPTTVRELSPPRCRRGVRSGSEHCCRDACLAGAPEALADAAAVIIDYTQGGVIASGQYQDQLASMARAAGALWIADETVSAFGRMGHTFAFQRGKSRPDMVVLGKGIAGGAAPGGALVLSRQVVEAIGNRRWMSASTFRGHPLTVAAVSAAVKTMVGEDLVAGARAHGALLERRLDEIVHSSDLARAAWGEGHLWFLELESAPEYGEAAWRGGLDGVPLPQRVARATLDHGALVPAYSGAMMWLVPPLVATETQLDRICDALAAGVDDVERTLSRVAG